VQLLISPSVGHVTCPELAVVPLHYGHPAQHRELLIRQIDPLIGSYRFKMFVREARLPSNSVLAVKSKSLQGGRPFLHMIYVDALLSAGCSHHWRRECKPLQAITS